MELMEFMDAICGGMVRLDATGRGLELRIVKAEQQGRLPLVLEHVLLEGEVFGGRFLCFG